MHRRRRTALLVSSAALLVAAPLLTGCGSDEHAGTAAVVDGQRITVSQLQGRVQEIRDALRDAVPDNTQYEQVVAKTGNLTRSTLQTMVIDQVVHRAAVDAGAAASRKEIQQMRTGLEQQAGGAKALERGWLQQYGVAPERLEENLRTELEAQKLAGKLGVDMNTQAGQNAFWKKISTTAEHMNIDMNPRYGTWDAKKNSRVDAKTPWLRDVTAPAPSQQQA